MHKTCIAHKFFHILELDLLHHHVLLDVQEGHGVDSILSVVHIDHFFEIHKKSGHEKCITLEYFVKKKLNMTNSNSILVWCALTMLMVFPSKNRNMPNFLIFKNYMKSSEKSQIFRMIAHL